jgi:hypothetical protein
MEDASAIADKAVKQIRSFNYPIMDFQFKAIIINAITEALSLQSAGIKELEDSVEFWKEVVRNAERDMYLINYALKHNISKEILLPKLRVTEPSSPESEDWIEKLIRLEREGIIIQTTIREASSGWWACWLKPKSRVIGHAEMIFAATTELRKHNIELKFSHREAFRIGVEYALQQKGSK